MTPVDEKRKSLARGEGLPEPLLLEDPMEALPPTAQRILAAAQRLLAGGGFEALKLSAIAREAGESKASIGYHFGNKAGLVTALVDSLAHDANRGLIEETAAVPAGEAPGAGAHRRRDAHRRGRRELPVVLRGPAARAARRRTCASGSRRSTTATARPSCAASTPPTPDAARGAAPVRDAHDRHRRRPRHPARPGPGRRRRARRDRALGAAGAAVPHGAARAPRLTAPDEHAGATARPTRPRRLAGRRPRVSLAP